MRALLLIGIFTLLLLPGLAVETAVPPAGQYAGTVKMTRHVARTSEGGDARTNDLVIISTAKAVASISATGELTLALATTQNPVPGKSAGDDVLRTQISDQGGFSVTVQKGALTYLYAGRVKVQGNTFELTYDDIPFISTNDSFGMPLIVPSATPVSFTKFSGKLRRVGP